MKIEVLVVGPLEVNCYIVWCEESGRGVIVDPGDEAKRIGGIVGDNGITVEYIINTHCHADHVGANLGLVELYGAPLLIHEADSKYLTSEANRDQGAFYGTKPSPPADSFMEEGQVIDICCRFSIKVLHTPGHTPGGVCLHIGDGVITGDTLFANSIGRSDLPPGGDFDTLINSIRTKILPLDAATKIYPGHGPESTVQNEIDYNPYLRF